MRHPRVALFVLAMALWPPAAPGADAGSAIELSSLDTAIRVEARNDELIITSLVGRADGFDWIGKSPGPVPLPFIQTLKIGDMAAVIHWKFAGSSAVPDRPGTKSLRFTCDDPPLELVSTWIAAIGPGPVEHELVIFNRGNQPVILPAQDSVALRGRADRQRDRAVVGGQGRRKAHRPGHASPTADGGNRDAG